MLGRGFCNKEIARALDVAERTVKAHVSAVFEALNVRNRTQAVLVAQRRGFLPGVRRRTPTSSSDLHTMDAALLRRVEQQRVAMLYDNTLAVSGSALLMAALIAIIAWPHSGRVNIAVWCGGGPASFRRTCNGSSSALSPRPAIDETDLARLGLAARDRRGASRASCGAPPHSCWSDQSNRLRSR